MLAARRMFRISFKDAWRNSTRHPIFDRDAAPQLNSPTLEAERQKAKPGKNCQIERGDDQIRSSRTMARFKSLNAINILAGRSGEARTPNPRFWRPVLYQLSYTPVWAEALSFGPRRFKHRPWQDCKGEAADAIFEMAFCPHRPASQG
jgi:hypothetical protein